MLSQEENKGNQEPSEGRKKTRMVWHLRSLGREVFLEDLSAESSVAWRSTILSCLCGREILNDIFIHPLLEGTIIYITTPVLLDFEVVSNFCHYKLCHGGYHCIKV